MKIHIYNVEKDTEKTIRIPTGFLFSRLGMYIGAKVLSSQSRREYDAAIAEQWKHPDADLDLDELITLEDVQRAERMPSPLTEEQARELLAALKDAKYLMHGLPLFSLEAPGEMRVRVDL